MKKSLLHFFNEHSTVVMSVGYKIILTSVVLLLCYFCARAFDRWIQSANNKIDSLDATIVPVLKTTSKIVTYLIGFLIVLDVFGVNTTSIITLLGAAGLAIGFALKDTLSNIAAGIVLLVLRPFKVGHFIEFGTTNGTVKEIGLLTTILETPDALYVSAPNNSIWGVPIKNFTRNGKRRLDLIIGISYSDSIDRGFEVFKDIIKSENRFLCDPVPQMMVHAMTDSSVNLQLRAWLTVEDYWPVYWELNKRVKEKIEDAGLTIPFPQRDLHLYNIKDQSQNSPTTSSSLNETPGV